MFEIIFSLSVGIVAAFVGAMVGGGGLLSVPALMLVGLNPQGAIATNRLASFGLSFGAIAKYWREGKIEWKKAFYLTAISLPATYIGTKLLIEIDKELLAKIAGFFIISMLPLIFFDRSIRNSTDKSKKPQTLVGSILYFLVSIYGGFFGAGTGTLARFVLLLCFKMKMVASNATDIVVGCLSSVFGLYLLLHTGFIDWRLGLFMFIGMLVGGWIGAHTAVKKGDEWVSAIFVLITMAMAIKLIFFGI